MGLSKEFRTNLAILGLTAITGIGVNHYVQAKKEPNILILRPNITPQTLKASPIEVTDQAMILNATIIETPQTIELLKEELAEEVDEASQPLPTPEATPIPTPTKKITPSNQVSKPAQTVSQKPTQVIIPPTITPTLVTATATPEKQVSVITNPQPNSLQIEQIQTKTPTPQIREAKIDDFIAMFAKEAGISFAYAKKIADCESGLIPTSRNASGASGLWQIMLPLHNQEFIKRGWNPETDWKDPYKNTVVAMALLRTPQGLRHWSCA